LVPRQNQTPNENRSREGKSARIPARTAEWRIPHSHSDHGLG
jgi:hypothetical protein